MNSPKSEQRLAILAFFSALSLVIGSAHASILVPLEGMPFSDVYDVFLVADTPADLASPKLAVAPRVIEFDIDKTTKRVRFGLQYSYEMGSPPLAQLTTSLRLHSDISEVEKIVNAARQSTGIQDLKIASSGLFTFRTVFFIPNADGSILQLPVSSSTPIDSTIAASVDLSAVPKEVIRKLFADDQASGGFLGTIEASFAIYDRKNDFPDWQVVVGWASKQNVLTVRALTFPDDPKVKSRSDIRLAIAEALGLPSVVSTDSSYVLGWDLRTKNNKESLDKLLAQAKAAGALNKVAARYTSGLSFPVNSLCDRLKGQIIDLATGDTGCQGLK